MVSALGLTMTRPSFRANWRVEARFGTGLAALMTPRQRANSPAVAIEPLVRSASLISSWFRAAPHESIREALHPRREVAHALRSAQQLAVEPDALEPVVQAEQIREAHAAMHFGGGARHEAADFGGVRLGLRGGERSLGGNRVEGGRGRAPAPPPSRRTCASPPGTSRSRGRTAGAPWRNPPLSRSCAWRRPAYRRGAAPSRRRACARAWQRRRRKTAARTPHCRSAIRRGRACCRSWSARSSSGLLHRRSPDENPRLAPRR